MNHILLSLNTNHDEIIPYSKYRFSPKLDDKSINNLTDVFCVHSLYKTRCMSICSRQLRLTSKSKQLFGIDNDNYTTQDINNIMKGKIILIVRRKILKDGTKDDNKYIIQKGYFNYIDCPLVNSPYQYCYVNVDIDGQSQDIDITRVFISTRDMTKHFQLDPTATEFIPNI